MEKKSDHKYKLIPDVIRYEDGKEIETYKINKIVLEPGFIENGVEITWYADDTEFEIWFPKEWNSITFPWYQRCFRNRSRNMRLTRKFRGNFKKAANSELVIYYSIYCSKTGTMAIGGSSPRMIIRS